MSEVWRRLQAVTALSRIRGQTVSQVHHSVGSIINVGIGKVRLRRFKGRKSYRRIGRYTAKAETDFLLWTTAWSLQVGGSVQLDGVRTFSGRIGREVPALVGKRVLATNWRDPLLQFTLFFGPGTSLRVDLRAPDRCDGNEWTLCLGRSYLWKDGAEGRFLISTG